MKQTISDIIDQQLDSADSTGHYHRIAGDVEGCRAWRNYHLIGDVIRGDVKSTGSCLIDRVQAALADEPTVLAPVEGVGAKAREETRSAGTRGDTLKAAGLFSLAASLALVAVLTQAPGTDDAGRGENLATTAVPAGAVVQPADPLPASPVTGDNTDRDAIAAEFGQMLVEHGEFTTTAGLNGLLAYAKLVSNQPVGE